MPAKPMAARKNSHRCHSRLARPSTIPDSLAGFIELTSNDLVANQMVPLYQSPGGKETMEAG
jgi:hypothetical protein